MSIFLRRWPALAWGGLGSAIIILALAWLVPVPLFQEGPPQGPGEGLAPLPLLPQATVTGEIRADEPGLSRVKVQAATYARRNTCTLEAELLQGGRVLATKKLNCSWFPDLDWVEIPFYLTDSNLDPGTYTVRFTSPDSDPLNAVAVMGLAGQGVLLRPVYRTGSIPLWNWLWRFRTDYGRLLLALMIFLACGGLASGVGAEVRRIGRNEKSR